jgi:hypothetical protein
MYLSGRCIHTSCQTKTRTTKQQLLPVGATPSIYDQIARAYQMQRLPRIHELCLNIPWTLGAWTLDWPHPACISAAAHSGASHHESQLHMQPSRLPPTPIAAFSGKQVASADVIRHRLREAPSCAAIACRKPHRGISPTPVRLRCSCPSSHTHRPGVPHFASLVQALYSGPQVLHTSCTNPSLMLQSAVWP